MNKDISTYQMKRAHQRAVQKQLDRDALALVRADWTTTRFRMLAAMAYRFVKGWLMAVLTLLFAVATFLFWGGVLAPEQLYAEMTALELPGFMALRHEIYGQFLGFSSLHAVVFGVIWMMFTSWHHYRTRAWNVRDAAERPALDTQFIYDADLLAKTLRENTDRQVVFAGQQKNDKNDIKPTGAKK